MMAAAWADAVALVEGLVVEHLLAVGALGPEILGVLLIATRERKLDRHQVCLRRQASIAAAPIDSPDASAPPMSNLRSTGTASVSDAAND